MKELYPVLSRRKSIRKFDSAQTFTWEELTEIEAQTGRLIPLSEDIPVAYKLVPREETTAKFGEYCLLFYSEERPGYCFNAGYLLEQMDLWMAAHQIGACWYGLARTGEKTLNGLPFVIMLAFGKSAPEDFRSGPGKFDRKPVEEFWLGEAMPELADVLRLAPSACNSQPWRVKAGEGKLTLYRDTQARSIIPRSRRPFFNGIDMGIALCFLEAALERENIPFRRTLYLGESRCEGLEPVAEYQFEQPLKKE